MDLFDHDAYFGTFVPVQTRSHPLLKHAVCACAAKQLGRAKGAKANIRENCSQMASMKLFDDTLIDWEREGIYHYDRSIALLMEAIQRDQNESSPDNLNDTAPAWQTSSYTELVQGSEGRHRLNHGGRTPLRSDIVVAAVCLQNS
jgi:hypothetical protein